MSVCESDWLGTEVPVVPSRIGRPPKDHSGRLRKLQCGRCGFIAYASAGALRKGRPSCCGEALALPNLRDRAVVEWDELERELSSYGRKSFEAAMRELGFTDLIAPTRAATCGAKRPRMRCNYPGAHCTKWAAVGCGGTCREHAHNGAGMERAA